MKRRVIISHRGNGILRQEMIKRSLQERKDTDGKGAYSSAASASRRAKATASFRLAYSFSKRRRSSSYRWGVSTSPALAQARADLLSQQLFSGFFSLSIHFFCTLPGKVLKSLLTCNSFFFDSRQLFRFPFLLKLAQARL